ncbi:MAG: DinB family protein [Planctomycetota bacterium]|nr:DinB family protein [Planctomycetota bacterium]
MSSESNSAGDLAAYRAAAHEVERLLSGDVEILQRPIERISGWSPVQHAAHLTLANELVLKNIASLAKGSGMLVMLDALQTPRALEILAAGQLPRGEAKSPRMVVPPLDIDVRVAREWATKFTSDLAAQCAALDFARAPRCFIPHQVLGPLDLAQWVRFGLVHTRHHLSIAREILALSS